MPLLNTTARTFQMREVSADKAYLSNAIVEAVVDIGAQPYIPFRSNCNGRMGGALWRKLFSDFTERPDEFYAHYHKRSNVESAFSMIKAKFGGFVRSKTPTAQVNEVLCKALCHNLCVIANAARRGDLPLAA